MKFFRRSIFFILASFLCVSQVQARHEISFGAGSFNFASGGTSVEILFGYRFALMEWLQVGGEGVYNRGSEQNTSVSIFQFFFGPTANIGSNLQEAYFATVGIAFRSGAVSPEEDESTASGSDDPSGTGFGITLGKRFPLVYGVLYRPTLGWLSTGTSAFVFQPLFFSLTF